MNYPACKTKSSRDLQTFTFESVGPRGVIVKRIYFTETDTPGFFNLALVDYDPATGMISDISVTDNKDRDKILATVGQVVYRYTEEFPERRVYFKGSNPARTRLYQMAIAANLNELAQDFIIFGRRDNDWELFVKGPNYEAFYVKRRS
jgi:hypothetical protein